MGNQPAAFQLHINHKLIPNVSQKVVVSFIYIQRKDGVYFMSTKKLLTLALGSALLVGVVAGCSSSALYSPSLNVRQFRSVSQTPTIHGA